MALRVIELIVSEGNSTKVHEILRDKPVEGFWTTQLSDNELSFKILTPVEESESIIDILTKNFSWNDRFRIIVLPVEATIPVVDTKSKKPSTGDDHTDDKKSGTAKSRVSREELYSDIDDAARLSRVYIILVVLSTIVATIGILNHDVVVIIGAMVIAPLLGPNVALSLATTLGDIRLATRSLKSNITGIITALFLAMIIGYFYPVDPAIPEIESRMHVGLGHVGLAIASGSAGALAFTMGVSSALVGVMIAVALLPPLVVLGLLTGSGNAALAQGTLLLFLTNLICINLAGVVTFVLQGIRPLSWWEAGKARRATRIAIILWFTLLAALALIIYIAEK